MMWAVGTVSHNNEIKLVNKFLELGVDAFVPLGKRITKPKYKKKPVVTTYKIFPGYIFVDLPPNFNFLLLMNLKVSFLTYKDMSGSINIIPIPDKVVKDLRLRHNVDDLFVDYDKKDLRSSFVRNQLVCWRDKGNYVLGFISRNTQGKQFAYVSTIGKDEIKIHVDLVSLL